MSFSDLLHWQNLLFALPFLGAILYLFLMFTGIMSMEHDVDFSADHDVDIDHDLDINHDVHGVEHDHDIHTDQAGVLLKILSVFGVGKCPISIIIISFSLLWGSIGLISNGILQKILIFPIAFFWISMLISFFVSLFLTGFIARGLARIMPATETEIYTPEDLIGRGGNVKQTVKANSGSAFVKDRFGQMRLISCRLMNDEKEVPAYTDIVVVDYNKADQTYIVKENILSKDLPTIN